MSATTSSAVIQPPNGRSVVHPPSVIVMDRNIEQKSLLAQDLAGLWLSLFAMADSSVCHLGLLAACVSPTSSMSMRHDSISIGVGCCGGGSCACPFIYISPAHRKYSYSASTEKWINTSPKETVDVCRFGFPSFFSKNCIDAPSQYLWGTRNDNSVSISLRVICCDRCARRNIERHQSEKESPSIVILDTVRNNSS